MVVSQSYRVKGNRADIPFVTRVHALVDLIDKSEGRAGQTLQSHEVEDC
jgi:hypothetical protein